MHHYPTPSWLRLRGNKTCVPSRLAPVTSNDGPSRASMTTAVLSPLRKQGDVKKVPAAPTAVLLQDSSAPPTATLPRTKGSGTSLPGMLAHSYTPIVHLDPLLTSIKGRSRASMREGRAGERADEQAHPLSLANACNPYCMRIPLAQDNTSRVFPLVLCLTPTHLGWDTHRQFYSSVQGPPGVETPTVGAPGRGLLRVDEQLPVEFQMGSLQQPLQPGTLLHFGSLEFMSLDGSYDMALLPPQRGGDNDGRSSPGDGGLDDVFPRGGRAAFGFVPSPSSPQEEETGQSWLDRRRHLVGCRASRRCWHPSGGHVGHCPHA
jgi:hypothetical protein